MCTRKSVAHKYFHLKDFLNESSIHGLRVILFNTPYKHARALWILFFFGIITWSHYIIINLVINYIDAPTEVRMSTNMVHVSNIPFPSVAVCSANKFSLVKINEFAEKIFEQQQKFKPYYLAQTTQEMAQHLMTLRGFYIFPTDNDSANLTVINRMDNIFTFMFNTTNYPIKHYLKHLAPDCTDLVIRGLVFGKAINTTQFFQKRMTSSSVCCIFNYKRERYATDEILRDPENAFIGNRNQIKFQSNSILNSVQFVLQTETDDYTYREFQNDAFQIYIFPQNDYATIQSNRMGEFLVNHNSIVEVPIQPEIISSSYRIRQFSPSVRHCYFPDEGEKILNRSYYSIDECLLLCRMDSMIEYCGCVSPPMADVNNDDIYCTFIDLPCLANWKYVWYGWDPFEYVHKHDKNIDDDITVGIRCPQCLPTCDLVNYNIDVNELNLRSSYGPFYRVGILKGLNNSHPLAIIKLYFQDRFIQATELDIVGDWMVLLNRFGGIMSLMYGFGIISYIEILYYSTGKFFAFCFLKWKTKHNRKVSTKSAALNEYENNDNDTPPAYSLYWKELQPEQSEHMQKFRNKMTLHLYK